MDSALSTGNKLSGPQLTTQDQEIKRDTSMGLEQPKSHQLSPRVHACYMHNPCPESTCAPHSKTHPTHSRNITVGIYIPDGLQIKEFAGPRDRPQLLGVAVLGIPPCQGQCVAWRLHLDCLPSLALTTGSHVAQEMGLVGVKEFLGPC